MIGKRTISLLALLLCADARSDEPARQADGFSVETFSRATLLRRFDRNGDGEVSKSEIVALREVFGQDVPMLPKGRSDIIVVA